MKRGLAIPGRREAGSTSERTLDGMMWGITGAHRPAGHTGHQSPPGSWIWGDTRWGWEGWGAQKQAACLAAFSPKGSLTPTQEWAWDGALDKGRRQQGGFLLGREAASERQSHTPE